MAKSALCNNFEYVIWHKVPDDGYLYGPDNYIPKRDYTWVSKIVSREIFLQFLKDKNPELQLEVFYTSCKDRHCTHYEGPRSHYDSEHFYMLDNESEEFSPFLID